MTQLAATINNNKSVVLLIAGLTALVVIGILTS